MEVQYSTTKQICAECGTEFETKVATLFGRQFIIGRHCALCSEKYLEIEQQKRNTEKQAEITAQRRRWRENCGIAPRYMSEDFSTFNTNRPGNIAEVYRKCVEYAEQFPIDYDAWRRRTGKAYSSLLLFSTGVWGIGKTHLVSAIAHRVLDRWSGENIASPVYLISEPELYDRIQQTYSYSYQERENKQSEQDIINTLCRVRLLIIDDLGKTPRKDMDFVRRTMFDIINRRCDALLPVVVTSNKDAEGLRDYLGNTVDQATLDRIIGMTQGKFIQMKGESYRRK